ncbi:MAG TPA: type II toxin-antitoxin system prevent-host-death family antitoxin [Gemmataceae bacterium]|nr:type II toxin-antitoxin system prevent-host-death family antitoxin [Gemmataceae bacterium]
MKHISMLAFRRDAERIIAQVQKGQRLILTRRGKPVARLEPILEDQVDPQDPIYSLTELAGGGASLSNAEIDEAVYGK